MPRDEQSSTDDEDEEEAKSRRDGKGRGAKRKFDEFECPSCSANNPFEEFGNNDEVLCGYCGLSLKAIVDDEGKLKLREP